MRLINVDSLKIEDFTHKKLPPYAILSHTWGDDEVTFQDMVECKPDAQDPKWVKITQTCRLTRAEGLKYAWIDTCCINKSSSAELAESISSMYRWYGDAKLCLVHLFDLADETTLATGLGNCRWATRGWTLQEIIAPKAVNFYNTKWKFCGSKDKYATRIAEHLELPRAVLDKSSPVKYYSIAERMSWAARRSTTRREDEAYCLLGIFDVSMPLIYGEGAKAFRRLQQAITEQSNDLTILAWRWNRESESQSKDEAPQSGLLASSPRQFRSSSNVKAWKGDFLEFRVTNKGLLIRGDSTLASIGHGSEQDRRYALRVGIYVPQGHVFNISLRRIGPNMFCRELDHGAVPREKRYVYFSLEEFYILEELPSSQIARSLLERYRHHSIHVPPRLDGFGLFDVRPRRLWDSQDRVFLRPKGSHGSGFSNILAVVLTGRECAGGQHDEKCIVLCDYRTENPQLYIFNGRQHNDLVSLVFRDSTRQNSLHWEDLLLQMPGLKGHGDSAPIKIHGQKISIKAGLDFADLKVTTEGDTVTVLSLSLHVVGEEESLGGPCDLVRRSRPPRVESRNM